MCSGDGPTRRDTHDDGKKGLEKGDPGIAMGQLLRYLDAIVPGKTLLDLLSETDPALAALGAQEQRRRARVLTKRQLDEIDF